MKTDSLSKEIPPERGLSLNGGHKNIENNKTSSPKK